MLLEREGGGERNIGKKEKHRLVVSRMFPKGGHTHPGQGSVPKPRHEGAP